MSEANSSSNRKNKSQNESSINDQPIEQPNTKRRAIGVEPQPPQPAELAHQPSSSADAKNTAVTHRIEASSSSNKPAKVVPITSNRVGVLGGGQLGRMMAFAAHRLGIHLTVLDPQGTQQTAANNGNDNKI